MSALDDTARNVGRFRDGRAAQYEEKMSSPYQRLLREITWQHVAKYLPREKGALVLDAGGATGYWSIRLAKSGYRAVLLDVSEAMLELAKAKIAEAGVTSQVEVMLGDLTDMRDFSESTFDAAIAVEAPLSFSSDPGMAVAELALVTRSGGVVAASALNRFRTREFDKFLKKGDIVGLQSFLDDGIRSIEIGDDAAAPNGSGSQGSGGATISRKAFSPEELEALFGANGLEVVSAIGKPIFASAIGGRLCEPEVFSAILKVELEHNSNQALWGSANVIELVASRA